MTGRAFVSDNESGAHAEVIEAVLAANTGHQRSYGADEYTARLQRVLARHFGPRAKAFPIFNGSGANVVALQALAPRWGAVVCASSSHVAVAESTAPETIAGLKLLTVPGEHGKLTPELIDRQAWGFGDEHRAQPSVVSIAQATEFGTVYTVDELRALTDHAHALGLRVHMDGSRLANAAAHLGVDLAAAATGVDVLSLGGTKNGLLFGEVIVVLVDDATVADSVRYLRKLSLQLASKMRFVSAQLIALYETELWLRSARHANAMAQRLAAGVQPVHPVEANMVFAAHAGNDLGGLADRDPDTGAALVRWVCSFDTTPDDVDDLLASLSDRPTRPARD